jgi:hypothetical protein
MNGNGFNKRINQSQADIRRMLAEWRSNNIEEVELPLSKFTLRVRDVGVIDLAVTGKIPNTMMDLVQQLSDNKITETQMMQEHGGEFGALLDLVFMNAVVFPPVAEEPDDDHISPKDFVYGDKLALFNWVNREANNVRPFRHANGKSAEPAPGGEELREETQ